MSGVVLHIGLYKTGSTSIQLWLREHPELLDKYGVRFPRGWLRRDNHIELALALMQPDRLSPARMRGTEWQDRDWRDALAMQVRDDLHRHQDVTTVLSAEDTALLRSDLELAMLADLIGDAHVVVYLRECSAFLAAWQDTLVHKLELPLSGDPEAFNHVGPDSWQLRYGERLGQWRRWFSQVTVFNYDRVTERDDSVIPSFASVLGIEPADVGDTARYWTNGRGGAYTHREPGLRWTDGLAFGSEP